MRVRTFGESPDEVGNCGRRRIGSEAGCHQHPYSCLCKTGLTVKEEKRQGHAKFWGRRSC